MSCETNAGSHTVSLASLADSRPAVAGDLIGRIEIPRLGLSVIAVEGTGPSTLPKCVHKSLPFCYTGEVNRPIAGQDQIEEFQMIRNFPGDLDVSSCRKHDSATLCTLRPEVIQEVFLVRKNADLQRGPGGNLLFEVCLALQQPNREIEDKMWLLF